MAKRGETRLSVYEYIHKRISNGETSPTVREICAALKIKSTSTAHLHLENLRKEGCITFDDNLQRTIRLTGKVPEGARIKPSSTAARKEEWVSLPLVGTVAAGAPLYAFEDRQEDYLIPKQMIRSADPEETFLLTVDGESMIDIGMLTGDRIIVTRSFDHTDGDIVVARVDGDTATVKRIYRQGRNVRLQPENKSMKPIVVPSASVEVIGKVIGLLRSY